jgi:sugar lactone lactonase YvrE
MAVFLLGAFFTLLAIRNPYGLSIGPDGGLYICSIDDHAIYRYDFESHAARAVVTAQNEPYEVRFDAHGDLWFVDMKDDAVRRRAKTGEVSTVATGFKSPHSLAFLKDGNLLVADTGNHRVMLLDPSTGRSEEWKLDIPLRGPRALDVAPDGTVYLALREGNALYEIDPRTRATRRLAPETILHGPKGVAWSPEPALYVADTEDHSVLRVDLRTGVVRKVAENLKRPHGVFADLKTLYVGDSENHRVLALPTR